MLWPLNISIAGANVFSYAPAEYAPAELWQRLCDRQNCMHMCDAKILSRNPPLFHLIFGNLKQGTLSGKLLCLFAGAWASGCVTVWSRVQIFITYWKTCWSCYSFQSEYNHKSILGFVMDLTWIRVSLGHSHCQLKGVNSYGFCTDQTLCTYGKRHLKSGCF